MMNKKLRMELVSLAVGLGMVLGGAFSVSAHEPDMRLGGQDRYETSIAICEEYMKGMTPNNLILASGTMYPDAVNSSQLSGIVKAPILINKGDKLDPRIEKEIKKYPFKKVFIIGGTAVVSSNVEKQLKDMGLETERLGGQDRYETSFRILERCGDLNKERYGIALNNLGSIYLVEDNYMDAITMGCYCATDNSKMLMVPKDIESLERFKWTKELLNKYDFKRDYSGKITEIKVASNLPNYEKLISCFDKYNIGAFGRETDHDDEIKPDSYLNNAHMNRVNGVVFKNKKSNLDYMKCNSRLMVANGNDFADAFCGTSLVGKWGTTIFFVGDNNNKNHTEEYKKEYNELITEFKQKYMDDIKSGEAGLIYLGGKSVTPDGCAEFLR